MEAIGEGVKEFLVKNVFSPMSGVCFKDWVDILRSNGWRVAPQYLPRALFITLNSIANSRRRRAELERYMGQIEEATVRSPVFVLGHWRSGTTHLHNILSLDQRFSYPSFFQVTNPHTFLSTWDSAKNSQAFKFFSPKTRLIDNMEATLESPMEDEVALTVLTGISPILKVEFPRTGGHYQRYLTFEGATADELQRWKDGFTFFMKKLTVASGKPLILKSPPHTCRIKLLLELFPDAKFIHIHRNPYVVFKSYNRSIRIMQDMMQLQLPRNDNLEDEIIEQYIVMHEKLLAEQSMVPEGRFFELSYESLEMEPEAQVRRIYDAVAIGEFCDIEPELKRYLSGLAGYRKSELTEVAPKLKEKIQRKWARYFAHWGYRL